VNYEISRVTRSETTDAGRVKRISVAVLVDGSYVKGANGEMTYQPRSKEEIDRITSLVRSAIGFDQKRGDQVEVVNLRFADSPVVTAVAPQGGFFSSLRFTTDDLFQGIQIFVIFILSGLVLFFVIRPLVRRIIAPDEPKKLAVGPSPDLAPELPENPALAIPENPAARLIEVAKIQGEVHAQSIQKVGELAERNPHETVAIIRQWMHETKA
jgi:flagellar M-ring protein FliF